MATLQSSGYKVANVASNKSSVGLTNTNKHNSTTTFETTLKPLASIISRMQVGGKKLTSDIIACKALAKLHGSEATTNKSAATFLAKQAVVANTTISKSLTKTTTLPTALKKCLPYIEVKAEFKGGNTVRIPKAIDQNRQESLVVRWVVNSARDRSTRAGAPASFIDKLSKEYQDIVTSNQACGTYKKLLDLHRTALANRGQLR